MSEWQAQLHEALHARVAPVQVFVRDDDVGWGAEALFALLDVLGFFAVPIDLAVIPAALTPGLARRLLGRQQPLLLHQHGWAHENHEPSGRKCEFGPARSLEQQRADIARGQSRVRELLGEAPPVFTPPWNRCTGDTFQALRELGFAVVSRDTSAGTFDLPGLAEVPITFDWFTKGLSRVERLARLTEQLTAREYVGIMLHHAVMDADDIEALTALLRLLADHRQVRLAHLSDVSAYTASP